MWNLVPSKIASGLQEQSKEEVSASTTGSAQLQVLWEWSSQWDQGLATTCMAWNKVAVTRGCSPQKNPIKALTLLIS